MLVQPVQQRSLEDLAEGSEEEEAVAVAVAVVAVPQGVLPDALRAVPEVGRQEVLLALVVLADLRAAPLLVRQEVPDH